MSESDTETLYEEDRLSTASEGTITPSTIQPKQLGKRGLEWQYSLISQKAFKIFISQLKSKGYTKDEIEDMVPEYYYDEDYHVDDLSPGFRRIKSTTNVSGAIGTSKGFSPYEWCGERSIEGLKHGEKPEPKWAGMDCIVN